MQKGNQNGMWKSERALRVRVRVCLSFPLLSHPFKRAVSFFALFQYITNVC